MSINILYEDRSVIIIEKPAGLATQTANVAQRDCVSLIREHLKKNNPGCAGEPYVGVVHRLDQPVAGVLVFAKDKKSAASLSQQVREGMMNKHYRAMVEGIVDAAEETMLEDLLYKDGKAGRAVIVDFSENNDNKGALQKAKLKYRTEKIINEKDRTILSIDLLTGRFHQIRAQLSHMGHPIVGDKKYGSGSSYPEGIALVADRLEFVHPLSGEKVEKVVDFSFSL